MTTVDLLSDGTQAELGLCEISGAEAAAKTICTVERCGESLVVRVDAHDSRMVDLIASPPPAEGYDQFLYEEDCAQIAVAAPGTAETDQYLLVNPCGSAKSSGAAADWTISTDRRHDGWSVEVTLPIPSGCEMQGLSVHRFYRGVGHEVQGIDATLPFPLDTSSFAVIVFQEGPGLHEVAEVYRRRAREAQEEQAKQLVASLEERIAARTRVPPPWVSLAADRARKRAEEPIRPSTGFLCWNEGYYQHALIDLWELTQDEHWIHVAIERMEGVWSVTGERQGLKDNVWGEVLPTWYDHADELGTAISLITGVILFPIARLMHLVRMNGALAPLWPRVEHWIERCRQAIAVHDREWIDLPGDAGTYLEPYQKGPSRIYPGYGSRLAPLNRAFFLALPMLYLGRLLGDQTYINKVARMARTFRQAMERMENGSVVWEYLTSRYPATGEDISHAHCQVLFTEFCCDEGIEFTEADLRGIAATLEKNVFRYGEVPCGTVRGLQPELNIAVASWGGLCKFVPHVFPKVAAVVETALSESPDTFGHDGWEIRSITMVEKARQRLEGQRSSP